MKILTIFVLVVISKTIYVAKGFEDTDEKISKKNTTEELPDEENMFKEFDTFLLNATNSTTVNESVLKEKNEETTPYWAGRLYSYCSPDGRPRFKWSYSCGVTLIADNLVLTAAHCIVTDTFSGHIFSCYEKPFKKVPVRHLNTFDRYHHVISRRAVAVEFNWNSYMVESIHVYPGFEMMHGQFLAVNDVALLKLKRNVSISDARPIGIGENYLNYLELLESDCLVATMNTSSSPLQLITNPTMLEPMNSCVYALYPLPMPIRNNLPNLICAAMSNHSSYCSGDSGTGLICKENNSTTWKLRGLVSFGFHKCTLAHPVFYVKIHPYLQWVNAVSQADYNETRPILESKQYQLSNTHCNQYWFSKLLFFTISSFASLLW